MMLFRMWAPEFPATMYTPAPEVAAIVFPWMVKPFTVASLALIVNSVVPSGLWMIDSEPERPGAATPNCAPFSKMDLFTFTSALYVPAATLTVPADAASKMPSFMMAPRLTLTDELVTPVEPETFSPELRTNELTVEDPVDAKTTD